MRYFIVRRKIRMALLLVLAAALVVSVVPWVYENVFVHDEDFVGAGHRVTVLQPLALLSDEVNRDVGLDIDFLKGGYVFSKFKIEDLELEDITVSAEVVVKGQILKDERGRPVSFSGKLLSRNTILNSKPFLPLRMSFKIANAELEIKELRLGKPHKLVGKIALTGPYKIDLRLKIDRLDMRRLSRISKIKGRDIVFGIVSGAFDIKGNLAGNIFSEGIIESRTGRFGSIEYDLVTIRLEGFGPIINIVDSSFKDDSGILTMEGYVDLRNFAEGGLFDGITIRSDVKTVVWRGWDISRKGADELSMEKDVSDKMRVGFRTMARDPLPAYNDTENPEEMSLQYKIGLENLKMKLKDNEEFFGIEHSVKF